MQLPDLSVKLTMMTNLQSLYWNPLPFSLQVYQRDQDRNYSSQVVLNGSVQPGTERESNSGAIIFNIGEQGTTGHPPPGPLGEIVYQSVRTLVAREANEIVVTDTHEVSVSGVFEEALT